MANLIPNGDIEMQSSKFYDENKYWLMDEVDKYMTLNQRQIDDREQKAI